MNAGDDEGQATPPWRDPSSVLFARIKAGEFASERMLRWRNDLKEIRDQMSALYVHRQIYDRLGRLIANNPSLQAPNLFLSELFEWYVTTNIAQAHRDAERDSRVISLANVIYEIADHPEELDYRQFLKLNRGSINKDHESRTFLDPIYRDFANPGASNHLDVDIVRADLRELQTAAEKVEDFRNQVSAHRARQRSITSISVEDIHSYVDTLEHLTIRYERLLFGASSTTLNPVVMENWTEIFRFPWIPADDRGHSVPYAATPEVILTLIRALPDEERVQLVDLIQRGGDD